MANLTRKEHIRRAQKACVDIHVLGAVIALLEGGTITTRRGSSAAQRIIEICKRTSQGLLTDMDAAEAKALRD